MTRRRIIYYVAATGFIISLLVFSLFVTLFQPIMEKSVQDILRTITFTGGVGVTVAAAVMPGLIGLITIFAHRMTLSFFGEPPGFTARLVDNAVEVVVANRTTTPLLDAKVFFEAYGPGKRLVAANRLELSSIPSQGNGPITATLPLPRQAVEDLQEVIVAFTYTNQLSGVKQVVTSETSLDRAAIMQVLNRPAREQAVG